MQVSWIDPDDLKQDLAALQRPAKPATLSHLECGPQLDALIRELAPPPSPPTPPKPTLTVSESAVQARAEKNATPGAVPEAVLSALRGKIDQLKAADAPAPLQIDPKAPLGRRLGEFAAWAKRTFGAEEVLVLDGDGRLLWGPAQPAELVLAALMAMNAGRRGSARDVCEPPQRLSRALAAGRQLTLLACSCQAGSLQAAVVHSAPLPEHAERELRASLISVVDAAP